MKKILNLLSIFFAVIGLCAMALTCHIIFIYPNLDRPSPNNSNAMIARTDTVAIDTPPAINIPQEESPVIGFTEPAPNTDLEADSQVPDTEQIDTNNQDIPFEYQSALSKANDYNNSMYMSKAAIYEQLTSEYGENFSPEAAQYAIDNIAADWNSNALLKAKDYSDTMYMSKAAIYDQLLSDYGEKFTQAEAQYAVDNLVADYNSNALQKARDYQSMNMSPEAIRDQLSSEHGERFTLEQADYAVANLSSGYNQESSSTLYSIPVEQGISSTNYIAENPVPNSDIQNNSEYSATTVIEPETQASTSIGTMVWLSETGSKYHNKNDCGNMNPDKAYQIPLDEAKRRGIEPCKKCF